MKRSPVHNAYFTADQLLFRKLIRLKTPDGTLLQAEEFIGLAADPGL
ncbi:hypothetical protein P9D34_18680 [Bacillus swezeyi]|nr:hypothetical protein [Bacillus swezeyi]MEC1262407.1 hypothetical protein [Bacillus swezeyi]MED2926884.1 hypothetical protein [Bacillus swezeyi]MED2943338.1 hypothetical protein [Bacillus swezeyi]MED2965554.1 hypothetical protein [Bacillus swezeyi]MED2978176.1 hypothetical protein [Bacillus swezeyi]